MSGQKGEFPPRDWPPGPQYASRVWIYATELFRLSPAAYIPYGRPPISAHFIEEVPRFPELQRVEFINIEEHAALIEQARREARAEMAKEVYKDLLNRPVDGWQAALMWLHLEIESAKASEVQR